MTYINFGMVVMNSRIMWNEESMAYVHICKDTAQRYDTMIPNAGEGQVIKIRQEICSPVVSWVETHCVKKEESEVRLQVSVINLVQQEFRRNPRAQKKAV